MKTPIQGFFTTSFCIIIFFTGMFVKTIPALWILLLPVAIVWLVALSFSLREAFTKD